MGDSFNVDVQDLLSAAAVMGNRGEEIETDHRQHYRAVEENLAALPNTASKVLAEKLAQFQDQTRDMVASLINHGYLLNESVQ